MDKKEIAQRKMTQRDNLDKKIKHKFDQLIHSEMLNTIVDFKSIALFASFGHEIETYTLIEKLLMKNYKVYLPRVEGKKMNFYKIKSLDNLMKSTFGILEPHHGEAADKDSIDVIVVPLLAFDKNKFRIGYGGGFYDAYLKDYSGVKIGIAYSFQFTEEKFVETQDVACDYIVTERGIE